MVLQTAVKERICHLCPKGNCPSFIAQKKLSLLLSKRSYSILFPPRWGWLRHNCSPPALLVISKGWHFTDTGEATDQDLSDCGPFLRSLPCLGTCGNLPAVAESISWTRPPGSLQSCFAYPTCGYLTCLWNHTLTIRTKILSLGNRCWESWPTFKIKY